MTRKHDRHVSDGTVHKLLPHHHEVRHSMLYYTINTYLVYTVLFISLIADGPHHYHPAYRLWSLRIFPSVPGSRLTNFYRDASSALLQLVNKWLNLNPALTGMQVCRFLINTINRPLGGRRGLEWYAAIPTV